MKTHLTDCCLYTTAAMLTALLIRLKGLIIIELTVLHLPGSVFVGTLALWDVQSLIVALLSRTLAFFGVTKNKKEAEASIFGRPPPPPSHFLSSVLCFRETLPPFPPPAPVADIPSLKAPQRSSPDFWRVCWHWRTSVPSAEAAAVLRASEELYIIAPLSN